jgi:hypothetical protein
MLQCGGEDRADKKVSSPVMDKRVYRYEEWALRRRDSRAPGWVLVRRFLELMLDSKEPFRGLILRLDHARDSYVPAEHIHEEQGSRAVALIDAAMKSDAPVLLRLSEVGSVRELLSGYQLVSSGLVDEPRRSNIFPERVEIEEWPRGAEGEIVLVVHHDGDRLFKVRCLPQEKEPGGPVRRA